MLRKLSLLLLLFVSLSSMAETLEGQDLSYLGEGVRQNKTLFTFDSYKMVHHAASTRKELSPSVARSLNFMMLADWGTFFTKAKMVEALGQALEANTTSQEFSALSAEISRFKNTMLSLPIVNGTQMKFQHVPGTGLQILMKGTSGFVTVFSSSDLNFSMKIFAIWLGKAHPDANNRENLTNLIENLWKNAQ